MLQKKEVDTLMLPMGKYWLMFFYVILISLSIAALFIFLGIKYHIPSFFIFGPLLSLIPAIFIRLKIKSVAKEVTVDFSEELIEITGSDILNDRFIYSDIKYFSVSNITVDHASKINFILRNGVRKRYIFFNQYDNDENISNNVLLYFSSYNMGKVQEEKIRMLPSFFLTKPGKVFVAVSGILILAVIIMQVVYKPKTILYSLIVALGAYTQIRIVQMNDRESLKKFRDEN
jgi:hypothetical protein